MRQLFLTKEQLARIEAELAGKIQQFPFASSHPTQQPTITTERKGVR
jgi:hypothetical protein